MFEKFDLFILDHGFQPVADWWVDRTGKSNFWLAKKIIVLSIIFFAFIAWFLPNPLLILCFVFITWEGYKDIKQCNLSERNVDTNNRVLNRLRMFVPHGIGRMTLVFIFSGSVGIVMYALSKASTTLPGIISFFLSLGLYICGSYFAACTPKPPSRLKAGNKLATHSA